MAQVRCEVSAGLRPSEANVAVADVHDRRQFLRIDRDFLNTVEGQPFLTVGIVHDDRQQPWVLIELPHEADSGVNRLWVRRESLLPSNGAGHDPV